LDESVFVAEPKSTEEPIYTDPDFILRPEPIARLDRVVGWHPHFTSSKVYFNQDPKLSKELIFTQSNMLLGFYPPLQKQRVFMERKTNNIDQMFVQSADSSCFAFTVCKSLEEKARDSEITIWNLATLESMVQNKQSIVTFKPPMKIIHSLSLSNDQESLVLGGKDWQMRDALLVYHFQDMIKYSKCEIIAR